MQQLTVIRKVNFRNSGQSRKSRKSQQAVIMPVGRVPRISRLMALAIRFDRLIEEGEIKDQADLARLGQVTRARVTQIMMLLQLAPDLQEAILFLPPTTNGRDRVREKQVRPIAAELNWKVQRKMWKQLTSHEE